MGHPDYSIITRHRWLWPLVDIAAAILWTARDITLRHEAVNAAKCHATHCNHH